ncbi:MAG: aromatic ring-hydroxylating dioxygenase subunit alpha [Rhodanobacteraceae bacterium]|nr:MAG: aromatic ring-hydroxylating dioxygenase subunit alpha [Rhodanobacteraceae bacterium]
MTQRHDHDLAPQALDHAHALPARFYVGAESAARDRRAVFAHGWQWLARVDQLAEAGDHVVAEIAGIPLLLVRGDDGVLRALHNVCRHRAGPLALCDGRGAKRLRCHYHGWTYALDGRLLSATEMDGARDFDIGSTRLPEAQVAEWRGLVFAALDPAMPFAELVAGVDARLGERPLDDYVFHRHYGYDIACDWKAYIDNYLEGYHVPHIHPELNRMLDYRDYVVETARWHSLQHSPLASDKQLYGDGEALYWFVWPNTLLNVLPDRMQANRVMPLAPGRCRVTFDYFYPPDTADLESRHASDHAFSDLVQRQDVEMCEIVQRGLESGSYVAGRLNPKRENGVHHFHELLREAYRTLR